MYRRKSSRLNNGNKVTGVTFENAYIYLKYMYIYRSAPYKGKEVLLMLPLGEVLINLVNTRVCVVTNAFVTF